MTISKYINDFITEYLTDIKINTNHLEDGSDKYGLFKSPARDVVEIIDGSYDISEYYQFYAMQAGNSEADRTDSDEFLERLTYWLDDFAINYEYPPIDGNRTVTKIEMTGCPYPMEVKDSSEVLYQISLKITYNREREVLL